MLDFYRGKLSARRLSVLVRQLSVKSALVRALNDGRPQWTTTDHLIGDLWTLWAKKDHPVRAAMEAKTRNAAKQARVIELRAVFEQRKHTYGLGGERA